MRTGIIALCLLAAGAPNAFCGVITLYDNIVPANDTVTAMDYTTNGAIAIGDSIGLGAPFTATTAMVELFNAGEVAGIFDATLSFYYTGSPLGSLIGTSTRTHVSVDAFSVIDLYFSLGNLDLPADVVFLLTPANQSSGLYLGIELYGNPPAAGTNTKDTAIVVTAGGASVVGTGQDGGNPALRLSQSDVPEPASWLLLGGGLALAGWRRRCRTLQAD